MHTPYHLLHCRLPLDASCRRHERDACSFLLSLRRKIAEHAVHAQHPLLRALVELLVVGFVLDVLDKVAERERLFGANFVIKLSCVHE